MFKIGYYIEVKYFKNDCYRRRFYEISGVEDEIDSEYRMDNYMNERIVSLKRVKGKTIITSEKGMVFIRKNNKNKIYTWNDDTEDTVKVKYFNILKKL